MPIPFTPAEQTEIRKKLKEAGLRYAREESVCRITVERLTTYAGISTGAFYKFYPSKEHLFYELFRELHESVYGPAIALLLEESGASPAEKLRNGILAGCEALEQSGMVRFWTEDAHAVLMRISPGEQTAQEEAELTVFRKFWSLNGRLRVSEALAADAMRSLIQTVQMRGSLREHYAEILLWMAEGICEQIFE